MVQARGHSKVRLWRCPVLAAVEEKTGLKGPEAKALPQESFLMMTCQNRSSFLATIYVAMPSRQSWMDHAFWFFVMRFMYLESYQAPVSIDTNSRVLEASYKWLVWGWSRMPYASQCTQPLLSVTDASCPDEDWRFQRKWHTKLPPARQGCSEKSVRWWWDSHTRSSIRTVCVT